MGTWGSGPFDSDTAEDFLDEMEERSARGAWKSLSTLFVPQLRRAEIQPYRCCLRKLWLLPLWLRPTFQQGAHCLGMRNIRASQNGWRSLSRLSSPRLQFRRWN